MEAKMQAFLQQFQDLKIQLEDITSATNNFDEKNCIGVGGFGKVYKGELSHSKGRDMAAIKRLDPRHGQGTAEFLKELTTLSRYRHENIIYLLGFCYQGGEMILVYEHASRGSLDRHLYSPDLTWSQRIKICLDVAKGLSFLHDPKQTHLRLIHCDIKSSNILLDNQWNAKLSDFGLSIMGSANEQHSIVITNPVGTHGYCDPQYAITHTLTKESDVYSFGVVLFEVLCGTLCCTYSNGRVQQNLVPMWIESYKQQKLKEIIFKNPTDHPMDHSSLGTFSYIAYRCMKESREDRPKMAEAVAELETALGSQEFSERELLFDYEEILKTAEPPPNYSSNGELWKLLSKGVLINSGKTWFSLNKKGEHCEMISFAECLDSSEKEIMRQPWYTSRFAASTYYSEDSIFKTHVKSQFLSPGITYTVNLVFNFIHPQKARKFNDHIYLNYKLQGETKTSISYLADKRDDGWWMCELYQFTTDQRRTIDLEILFNGFWNEIATIQLEGIEFRPLEKDDVKLDMQLMSDSYISDSNGEEKLPIDFEDIMKWSKDSVQWKTKKEAYSIIRKGFLINCCQEWFSLDKNGKKCHMISARVACTHDRYDNPHWLSLSESRFGEARESWFVSLGITCNIQSQLISSQTTYACYLVYKFPKDQYGFEAPVKVENEDYLDSGDNSWYIYLASPQTPVIRLKSDQNTHNQVSRPKIKGLPQKRNDGWMEVQIWEFHTAITIEMIPIRLTLSVCNPSIYTPDKLPERLIVQGVEFRPI